MCIIRYLHGLKEGVDEHPFFSEASGSLRSIASSPFDSSWRSNASSLAQLKHGNCSAFPSTFSQMQMHDNHTDVSNKQQMEQHSFSLGPVNMKRVDEPQQPLRQFFDEWPLKNRDSWLDLEEDPSNQTSFSATQLSISIPMASSEFPPTNRRSGNGNSTTSTCYVILLFMYPTAVGCVLQNCYLPNKHSADNK